MKIFLIVLLFVCPGVTPVSAQEKMLIKTGGKSLLNTYLNMHVENLWIAGHHVDWTTGLPDKPNADAGIKTHCSAFVAAACKILNIYILRPPDHTEILLANAQFQWLPTRAAKLLGWHQIVNTNVNAIYFAAQQYANKGFVVVAVYKNPIVSIPGHIALVMPNEISAQQLLNDGPSVTMAGSNNFKLISLKMAFKNHINQWPEPAILFYYNDNSK